MIMVNVAVLNQNHNVSQQLDATQTTVIKTQSELSKVNENLDSVKGENKKLNTSLKESQSKSESLKKENADLKAKKQAKLTAAKVVTVNNTQPRVVAVNGSCADWLAKAGVTDVSSAMTLINRESGCNPNAVNPSSGACGVGQELPCGKSGCSLGDGACQVAWMKSYVEGRYGSFAAALAHSNSVGWY